MCYKCNKIVIYHHLIVSLLCTIKQEDLGIGLNASPSIHPVSTQLA